MLREKDNMEQIKVLGERYIGCGASDRDILLEGTPGNALGAYLDGAHITLYGNAQDATGDTMNAGKIAIHGSTGDAAGYAMRGGSIFVRDSAGYRAGIHMKQYKEKTPLIVIGTQAGSFLGEYLAGGTIVVLGIGCEDSSIVGNFCGTGMHGGSIYLRTMHLPPDIPKQVTCEKVTRITPELDFAVREYCRIFGTDAEKLLSDEWYVFTPNTKNPYKQLYIYN